jgi:hypothetical protein
LENQNPTATTSIAPNTTIAQFIVAIVGDGEPGNKKKTVVTQQYISPTQLMMGRKRPRENDPGEISDIPKMMTANMGSTYDIVKATVETLTTASTAASVKKYNTPTKEMIAS